MTAVVTAGAISFTNEVVCVGGLTGSGGFNWGGTISGVALYNRYLTATEKRQMMTLLNSFFPGLPLVCLEGNSLVSGSSSTSGPAQITRITGDNFPSYMALALNGQARVVTDAFPGRTGDQLISQTPAYSGIFAAPSPRTVTAVWEGANTLAVTLSPKRAYDTLVRVCNSKRRLGMKVAIMTVLSRGDTGNNARFAALATELNRLIRANWMTFADGLIDVAADSRLSNIANGTYFDQGDQTHLLSAGYKVVSDVAEPVVRSLMAAA
jgi:hypothetical protein